MNKVPAIAVVLLVVMLVALGFFLSAQHKHPAPLSPRPAPAAKVTPPPIESLPKWAQPLPPPADAGTIKVSPNTGNYLSVGPGGKVVGRRDCKSTRPFTAAEIPAEAKKLGVSEDRVKRLLVCQN